MPSEGRAEDLKHWHFSVGCAIHDCHNSMRWGWEGACSPSSQVLKDMHSPTINHYSNNLEDDKNCNCNN
eukprot:6018560-Amphidinium_carterae.1